MHETLNSIVHQTYKDWELIIINDGSTDSTESIVRGYMDAGCPIIYRYQQNKGLSYSRNKAIDLSQGEYIALIDHDDIWIENKLSKQIAAISSGNFALCYGGVLEIDSAGREIGASVPAFRRGNLFEALLKQFDVNLPTVLFRASAIRQSNLLFDEKVTASEEYCLFMQLAVKHDFYSMGDILAKYRIHDGALTNASISKWAEEREYTLNTICDKHHGIREKYPAGFKEAYARASYYRARYYMFKKKRGKAIREMASVALVGKKYFMLFLVTFLPIAVWNIILKIYSKRNV